MKKIIALMLALVLAFALCACGGSSAPASTASDVSATPAETAAPAESAAPADETAAPAESDGAQLTTSAPGKLVMATNATFPPYEYYESSEIVGIDAEIAGAIADKLGLELVIEDMEFDSIIEAVKSGKVDIGMAGMTVTPDRAEAVHFTDTYSTGIQVVIVTEDSSITSLDDLFAEGANHVVGVQRNTTGDMYATSDIEDAGLGTLDRYSKATDAAQALKTGKVDCVIIDNGPAQAFVQEIEGLKILDTEYAVEDYAGAMSYDNEELYNAVNEALAELIADGTVQSIVDKYITAD